MGVPEDVPDREMLLELAKYQSDCDYEVRFRFRILSGDDKPELFVYALKRDGIEAEDLRPAFRYSNCDPLPRWEKRGLIEITTGSIRQGYGVFVLSLEAASSPLI